MRTTIYLLAFVLIFSSCYRDEHTFISEPFDPRMPQYSEEGANVAGAYVNERVWISKRGIVSGWNSSSVDTIGDITFYFSPDSVGSLIAFEQGDVIVDEDRNSCCIGIFLGNLRLNKKNDLYDLEGAHFELDGTENFGLIVYSSYFRQINIQNTGTGSLYIRRVKRSGNNMSISGTFGFSIQTEQGTNDVFSGRFDYQVDNTKFKELYP